MVSSNLPVLFFFRNAIASSISTTDPGAFSVGLRARGVTTGAGLTFTFTHPQNASPADDVSAPAYRWSTNLQTFHADGAANAAGTTTVTFTAEVDTPVAGTTTVTATITGSFSTRSRTISMLVKLSWDESELDDLRGPRQVVLVFDFADDLFEQVGHRDQSEHVAVFVHDQRGTPPVALKVDQLAV